MKKLLVCALVAAFALTACAEVRGRGKQGPQAENTQAAQKVAVPKRPLAEPQKHSAPFPGWTAQRKRVKALTPKGEEEKEITYYKNSLGMEFVKVPAGEFMMGSPSSEKGHGAGDSDEGPVHKVRISKPFFMQAYEVTNEQYRRFKRGHKTRFQHGDPRPVDPPALTSAEAEALLDGRLSRRTAEAPASKEYKGISLNGNSQPAMNVSWDAAKAFCDWLSRKEGIQYRLPTEAEWEYACRAGSSAPYPWGDKISAKGCNFADKNSSSRWRDKNADDGHAVTAPVGSYLPNSFGLYDMIGNVSEWCQDCYGRHYYKSSPEDDPKGPSSGDTRVVRPGSWRWPPLVCRAASRSRSYPDPPTGTYIGFRVVAQSRGRP